jgi:diamine N-acetyltransferase
VNDVAELVIREALLEDQTDLLPMMRKLSAQEPGKINFDEAAARTAFRKLLSQPAFGRVWLLCEDHKSVGYVILTVGFSFEFHGHDAFIDELYIEPVYRRRGYAREAVTFLEKKAFDLGVNAVHLEVDRGNHPAFELYRRAGYQDHDRFLMTKWLDRAKP